MSKKYFDDVTAFYNKMNFFIPEDVSPLSQYAALQRITYLMEEQKEIKQSLNIIDFVDGVIDLVYIAIGASVAMGYKEYEEYPYSTTGSIILDAFKAHMTGIELRMTPPVFHDNLAYLLKNNPPEAHYMLNMCFYTKGRETLKALKIDFDTHWNEVHQANMRKVPATKDNPSKRGFVENDSVKPNNWIGPRHESFLSTVTELHIIHTL
jgi:predicted HAD superfamily Cof-like phosphohydrolase